MTAPVSYLLRPSKNMERKMICESCARLSRIAPLRRYQYIGFGGLSFIDFAIFHHRLGIHDMVSMEDREDERKRFEFNRPYSCIKIKWGDCSHILRTFDWDKRTIVWLDYDSPGTSKHLDDIHLVSSRIRSGGMLIVTLPVDPGEFPSDESIQAKRMDTLTGRVGKTRIPIDIEPKDLAKWGTARVYRRIINDEIATTISSRNAAIDRDKRVQYTQLFNFHYQDGRKMLTVGGIILNPKDSRKLNASHFGDLQFIRTNQDEYQIRFPTLTNKEARHLNARLPSGRLNSAPNWLPEEDRKGYSELYRYFPNYIEAEV